MVCPDDTEIRYRNVGNLWCLVTTSEGTGSEKGTAVKHPNSKKKETFDMAAHVRGGHAEHDPECKWCNDG